MNNLIKYRPEIDGLRAISILFVLLFHSKFFFKDKELFEGGYIGVDIFFVISGYLITSILLVLFNNKKKPFIAFFLGRSRRLLPALYFTVLISILFFFNILSFDYYEELTKSAISTVAFYSNFFFHYGSDYFSAPYEFKPLIHTWSLSVEIQFYFFYPFLLFFFNKFLKNYVIHLFITLIALNLLLIQYGGIFTFNYPYIENNFKLLEFKPNIFGSFYWTSSRIWEFLIGALAHYLIEKKNFYTKYLKILGLILIFLSLILFDKNINHPSFFTVLPVLGAFFFILDTNNCFVKRIFSYKKIVLLGLISYSVYLIHFPLFSLCEYIILKYEIIKTFKIKLFFLILSILIGWFSWKFLETSFRNKEKYLYKHFFLFILILLFSIILSFFFLGQNKVEQKKNIYIKYFNFDLTKKYTRYKDFNSNFSDNKTIKVLILGDSQSIDLYKILEQNLELKKYFEFRAYSNNFKIHYLTDNSRASIDKTSKLITSNSFKVADYVIIINDYDYRDFYNFEDSINILKNYKKKIILSKSFPNFRFNDPVLDLMRNTMPDNKNLENIIGKLLFKNIDKRQFKKNKLIDEIAFKNNLKILNYTNIICDFKKLICPPFSNNKQIIFNDRKHLTDWGASFFSNDIRFDVFFKNLIKELKYLDHNN